MPRSLRASFSLRLGKGSGVLVFDQEAGAYQSCVCPVLVRVMPGTGAAGVGGGDAGLSCCGRAGEVSCSRWVLLTGRGTEGSLGSRCSLGMTMLVASSV